jgi:hypothetical protein
LLDKFTGKRAVWKFSFDERTHAIVAKTKCR